VHELPSQSTKHFLTTRHFRAYRLRVEPARSYLAKENAHEYQRWIDNDHRIRELLTRLEAIAIAHLQTNQHHD
jgi:hypothetical protein